MESYFDSFGSLNYVAGLTKSLSLNYLRKAFQGSNNKRLRSLQNKSFQKSPDFKLVGLAIKKRFLRKR
jgi:hypothetical protein